MLTISIITIVSAAVTIYLCYDEYKNGKMSSKNFKIVAVCEGLAILGMIFLIISQQLSSGGSQALFFKVNTFGEEAFLDKLREIL